MTVAALGAVPQRRTAAGGAHRAARRAAPQRQRVSAGAHRPAPERRYATAGAVFAAASAVAVAPVAPVAPWVPELTAAERAIQLAAEASFLNIPFNLIQDFFNVPYNVVQATNVLNDSFFFTGNWWTPSATNIWGEDPGDPGHFMAVFDYLLPFAPQASGLYQPTIDPDALANGTAGLGQQIAIFAAAMLPVSASCDPIQCYPITPVEPITGITALDRTLQFFNVFTNFPNDDNQMDLFRYWLKVPLQQLFDGYRFPASPFETDNPTAAGIANPVSGIGEGGAVPGSPLDSVPGNNGHPGPGFGYPGTVPLLDDDGNPVLDAAGNPINMQPWAGLDFTFNPLKPFELWFNSLMEPVDWSINGDDPLVGFHILDPADVAQTFKALLAGLVIDFNPYVPGSPLCPGLCMTPPFAPPFGVTTLDLVKTIQSIGAPNPSIQQWIDLTEQENPYGFSNVGNANGATDEQVLAAVMALQTGLFTFDEETQRGILDSLADINPYLPNLVVNAGLLTDPGFLGPWEQDAAGKYMVPGYDPNLPLFEQQVGEYGGYNTLLLWDNFLLALDPSGGLTAQLDALWDEIMSWFTF
ncbi:hypothetical protein [Mycolicibacter longobardus]|uniref:hypothetical protein n=1 Tax=Mycolicibacter longobardus TaxID=1108812 RepID=UPI001055141A|nr:hypothetical protein [Mycolicibacter longobardus]MCV7384532.1 hypothetical protein [Mycolicibacter longobardus]